MVYLMQLVCSTSRELVEPVVPALNIRRRHIDKAAVLDDHTKAEMAVTSMLPARTRSLGVP